MTSPFEVLVVSSDSVLRHRLADILVTLGINPLVSGSLRECQEVLAHRRVGLVFCDPQMEDGNYRDLLERYPAPIEPPRVVVTSGTADWDEFKEAIGCGAFDVISVPCRQTDVEWMVIQAKRAERRTELSRSARVEQSELAMAVEASTVKGTSTHQAQEAGAAAAGMAHG
jgi:DNA-binding NtrC family response regulator